jgi:hypothetical protein
MTALIYPHRAHQVNTLGEQELVISFVSSPFFCIGGGEKERKNKSGARGAAPSDHNNTLWFVYFHPDNSSDSFSHVSFFCFLLLG